MISKKISQYLLIGAGVMGLTFYSCKPNLELSEPDSGDANFSNTIALGGTFLSGYTNGVLQQHGQQHSVASLIVNQLKEAGASEWNQALMPDEKGLGINFKTFESDFIQSGRLGYFTDCNGVTDLSPLYDNINASSAASYLNKVSGRINDFSLPTTTTVELFNPSLSNPYGSTNRNPFFQRIASSSGSATVIRDAKALNATFQLLWLGVDDIFNYARTGGYSGDIPSASVFETHLDQILSELGTRTNGGVIANIPDLDVFPFFTYVGALPVKLSAFQADSLNGVTGGLVTYVEGDNGLLVEYPKVSGNYRLSKKGEHFLLSIPADSLKCQMMGVFYPVPDMYYLDSSEVALVQSRIKSYNAVIAKKANEYNIAHADMNAFFNQFRSVVRKDGVDFSNEFISGGFFSTDGFSTTERANALIANEWIKSINLKYNARVPFVECATCKGLQFP